MKVIKRNGKEQNFDIKKIENAIKKANNSVDKSIRMDEETIGKVMKTVLSKLDKLDTLDVETIQDYVESSLVRHNKYDIAKAYITYRHDRKLAKKFTTSEEQILSLVDGSNDELRGDNANKRIDVNSSKRDYIAGVMCKSIARKTLPKKIVEAHDKGLIHYHDMDYSPLMPMHNCCLLNIEDMLLNGFQMGDTHIDSPKTFSTACNLVAQINLITSGSQYGGQTISWSHLLPFVERTRQFIRKQLKDEIDSLGFSKHFISKKMFNKLVEKKVRDDIHRGVKTYQYQVICHQSSNGQTPFVTNSLCLREASTEQELKDMAIIIEEVLKRRLKGVKNEKGQYIGPLFPKLLYWTCDGLNVNPNDPYYYLTKLASECITKRMQPDIMSEKKCREIAENQIIPTMGCRSKLAPIWEDVEYSIMDKLNWEYNSNPNEDYLCFNLEPKYLRDIPNGDYSYEYPINFRGNTGWVTYKDDTKVIVSKPIVYGRWNEGVITINTPHVALEAEKNLNKFWSLLEDRLELCHQALLTRHESICKIKAKNSPILWMYGALSRLDAETSIEQLMKDYPTRQSISLGYVGLFEVCQSLIGESNTSKKGRILCKQVLQFMSDKCKEWSKIDGLNYSLYGTPEESLTWKFAKANQRDFGVIEKITDKEYVVNSYHVDPREVIDAFTKLKLEGEFQALSSGGAISYIETANMANNTKAIEEVIRFIHNNIYYAEINTKLDTCFKCGYQGEMKLIKTDKGEFKFRCPNCGNEDSENQMDIIRRICGYLGKVNAGNTNRGRLDDIYNRYIHLGN